MFKIDVFSVDKIWNPIFINIHGNIVDVFCYRIKSGILTKRLFASTVIIALPHLATSHE